MEAIASKSSDNIDLKLEAVLKEIRENQDDACNYQLPVVHELFEEHLNQFLIDRDKIIMDTAVRVDITSRIDNSGNLLIKKGKVKLKDNLERAWLNKGLDLFKSALLEFGYQNFILLHQSKNIIHKVLWTFIEESHQTENIEVCALDCKKQIDAALNEIDKHSLNLAEEFYKLSRNVERELLNDLSKCAEQVAYKKAIHDTFPIVKAKELKATHAVINSFPHFWKRNIILFSYHLQADLYLLQYSTKVDEATKNLISKNDTENISVIEASIATLE